MTQGQQKQFIKELIDSIHSDMRDSIELGKIPDNWDGHELRQYLADRFAAQTSTLMRSSRRRQDYENDVLVRNL